MSILELGKSLDITSFSRCPMIQKKVPYRILILARDVKYYPTVVSEIDYYPKDRTYDLVVYVDRCFRMSLEYPFSIANSEIWFERGEVLTKEIFFRAMKHYSECEIRNGI